MSDLGPWDVVAALRDLTVANAWAPYGIGYTVPAGARAILVGWTSARTSICPECGSRDGPGMILDRYPLVAHVAWCRCEWKRIGGDKDAHVAWFAEYLKPKPEPLPLRARPKWMAP